MPFIVLIAAAGLFIYIKKNQRGPVKQVTITEDVQPNKPPRDVQPNPAEQPVRIEGLDRRTTHIFYSKHARCRMDCRHIDESEVKEILLTGTLNSAKIEEDARGKTFPLEGVTHDNQRVRIVFAPKDDGILVVTCIDLGRDWACDCK